MGRELSHGEVVDLLGAYALDALDTSEHDAVDRHVGGCQECADEVVQHREVAGLLTPGWAQPPAGLWEKIAASLEDVPPPLDLTPVIAMKPRDGMAGRGGDGIRRSAAHRRRPRRSLGVGIAAMVAVAAVALVGVLGVRVADDRRRIDQLAAGQNGDALQRTVDAALAAPGARKVSLTSADGFRNVDAVVLPDGIGYLVTSNLPALAKERTYQLWAVDGTTRISIGVIGAEPHVVPFKMDPKVSTLAITDEVAGGVVSTSRDPVVIGRV